MYNPYPYNSPGTGLGSTPVHPGALPQAQAPAAPAGPQILGPIDPAQILRGMARKTLAFGIIDCAVFFFLGYVAFNLICDPMGTADIINSSVAGQMFLPLMVYFFFMMVYGAFQGTYIRGARGGRMLATVLLTIVPGLLVVLMAGLLMLVVPFLRGILIILPVLGSIIGLNTMAMSCLPGPPAPFHRTLGMLELAEIIISIVLSQVIELFLVKYPSYGAAIMYIGFISMGLLVLWESLWVHAVATANLPSVDAAAPRPSRPKGFKNDPLWTTVVIFIVVTAVCAVAFKPPLERYFVEPKLEIKSASLTHKGHVSVTIINKAGNPVVGRIQVWANNTTKNYLIGETDRVDGFSKWIVSGDLSGNLGYDEKAGVNISLTVDGKEVAKRHVRYNSAVVCMIPMSWIFIGVGLVMPYYSKHVRRRRDSG